MEKALIISGSLIGLNEYTKLCRGNRYAAASAKKAIETFIYFQIKQQLNNFKVEDKVFLKFTWIEKNKKRDMDNIAFAKKFVIDALVKSGVIKNDGWAYISGFSDDFEIDKINPRIIVKIAW